MVMALIMQVVDDNDQLLANKEQSTIDFDHEIYRVSALWLTNSKGEILIAQRKHSKLYDGGKWGPAVAGTVEAGETYETNIYKEAEEEIGLTGVEFKISGKQRLTSPRNYFCQWYLVTIDRPATSFIIQTEEVEQVKWINPSTLAKEVAEHPDQYISDMPAIIKFFSLANSD